MSYKVMEPLKVDKNKQQIFGVDSGEEYRIVEIKSCVLPAFVPFVVVYFVGFDLPVYEHNIEDFDSREMKYKYPEYYL